MKGIVKLLVVIIGFSITTELMALNFGAKAGLNFSNIHSKGVFDNSLDINTNLGFHVGTTAEFPLTEMISLETGLLLSRKGFKISKKFTDDGKPAKIVIETNLLYLDIPLTARFLFYSGGYKIYGLFGPYLGMGLIGKGILKGTYNGIVYKDEYDVKWDSDDDDVNYKRLDYGLTMGTGIEINSFQIGLIYSLGLANISAYYDDGAKICNRVLELSVGYKFGGGK